MALDQLEQSATPSYELKSGPLDHDGAARTTSTADPESIQSEIGIQPDEGEKPDVIPNGGYGWVNVGCVVAQNSVTWGMRP
jgi:hypothetical protein